MVTNNYTGMGESRKAKKLICNTRRAPNQWTELSLYQPRPR